MLKRRQSRSQHEKMVKSRERPLGLDSGRRSHGIQSSSSNSNAQKVGRERTAELGVEQNIF